MNKNLIYLIVGIVVIGLIWVGYQQWGVLSRSIVEPALEGWKTLVDENGKVLFQYPENSGSKYIEFIDWPPLIEVSDSKYECSEEEEIKVNNHSYCVKKSEEGVAGSVYVRYSYGFGVGNQNTAFLVFSIRKVQCSNYDDPEKSDCQKEQDNFNIDGVVDKMIQSIK